MALDFFLHAERYGPDAKGLMLRKTREDLKDTIDLATRMYRLGGYREKGNVFHFANGARLVMRLPGERKDAQNYQGWSAHPRLRRGVDPAPTPRSGHGAAGDAAAPRACAASKATCNPGGPGHHWVKAMFIDNGPYKRDRPRHGHHPRLHPLAGHRQPGAP